ncbi:unnamed protein product [Orchesella dallaii]|uniref:Uncharacterized protein n=1 Tax=Orchesella dallaii TaxID=48710 RepID=A0ABP1RY70_9HEXA
MSGQPIDYIGLILNAIVIKFWLASPLVIFASGLFFHMMIPIGPLQLIASGLFPFKEYESLHQSKILVVIEILVGLLISNEIARALSLILSVIIIFLYMTTKALGRIDELHQRNRNAALKQYNILYILHSFGKEDTTHFLCQTLIVGYCILGLAASATIMGLGKLPIAIYWLFPLITFIGVFSMVVALPLATRFSSAMKTNWYIGVYRKRTKFHRKSVMALRRVSFYFGAMREITDEFKLIYFSSVIDRFTDFLLLQNT